MISAIEIYRLRRTILGELQALIESILSFKNMKVWVKKTYS